jgi:dTDP-4-amino-4,6-dideoxygalactose transaminase
MIFGSYFEPVETPKGLSVVETQGQKRPEGDGAADFHEKADFKKSEHRAPATIAFSVNTSPKIEESKPIKDSRSRGLTSVPLLDLKRQYDSIGAEVLDALGRVCASQRYILGAEVEALESELATYCGTRDAVGCASGTDALWLSLAAAGMQPGDQVLTTPFSFFASASAIIRVGARPVFVDIEPRTFNLDATRVAAFLHSAPRNRLRALVPVHLYGQCADMGALQQVANEFHLQLIEDAAQAIGASWEINPNKIHRAGSMGIAAAFSFYPTKNLSAYGDAGLVTTSSREVAAHIRRLRNHGSSSRYVHEEFGWNSRLDAIQAAVLRVKLKYIEGWNQARRDRAAVYDRLFSAAGLTSTEPESAGPIQLPFTSPHAHHVFHQYVVRAYRRDELREFLAARKIGTEIYYPIPLHLQPCFVYLGYREGDFREAERASKEVLALPMFPELTEEEQRWVVASIADFYC